MFRNPRRTRAGVSRPGGAGRSQGRRRSAASGRARRSWAWQAMISQVHRSAAAGSRIFGAVQPRTCLNSRKVCSRSNRRKNDCQHRSTSAGAAPVRDHHSHTGLGSRSPGRCSTCSRIRVPSMTGSVAVVIEPGGAVGEPGVHPVPGGGHGGPVPGGHRAGGDLRVRAGRRVGQGQLAAVLAGPAVRPGLARRRGQPHHPVAAQPPEQLHRQVRQQPGQPGHVVAGVEDDQDPAGRPRASARRRSAGRRPRGPGPRSPRSHRHRDPAAPRPAPRSRRCGPAPAPRSPSTASPGSSAPDPSRGRRRGRTAAPGWWPRRAAASYSHRRPAPAGHRRPAVTAARPATAAAGRYRSGRGSPRHTARHGRAGAPGPATARPGP